MLSDFTVSKGMLEKLKNRSCSGIFAAELMAAQSVHRVNKQVVRFPFKKVANTAQISQDFMGKENGSLGYYYD